MFLKFYQATWLFLAPKNILHGGVRKLTVSISLQDFSDSGPDPIFQSSKLNQVFEKAFTNLWHETGFIDK